MRIYLKLCMISFIFLIDYSHVSPMDPTPETNSVRPRKTTSVSSSDPVLEKHSGRSRKTTSISGSKGESRSPSPNSSKRSSYKPNHILYLFGKDNLPIKGEPFASIGNEHTYAYLKHQLTVYNIKELIIINSDEDKILDQDCNFKLADLLNQLGVTHNKKNITILKLADDSKKQMLLKKAEIFSESARLAQKPFAIYSLSTNLDLPFMLAYWSIPTIIDYIRYRSDSVIIHNESFTISEVLLGATEWRNYLIDHIMDLTYQRIIQDRCKSSEYISEEHHNILKNHCQECLRFNYKNPNK